jgi:hydrogenase maturation factor
MASASGCGADVLRDALPVLPETIAICGHFGIDPLGLLSSGALLIAVSPQHRRSVELAAGDAGIPIARIGRLTESGEGVTMIGEAGRSDLPRFDSDEITRVL